MAAEPDRVMPMRVRGPRHIPRRIPRALHPVAWWIWALGLAVATSRTTNPLILLLILCVLAFVVSARRTEAPWARAFKYYVGLAGVVIAIRVVFRAVFGGGITPADHVLVTLPQIPLPGWFAGVQLGGPVSVEAILSAAVDGLRLGCLLCCIGAANALANPKRALRVLPGALYELGVAVVVSISVAPQLVESGQRVNRARRLRAGRTAGLRAVRSVAIPVLEDALDRSLRLAAAMESRGYGRVGRASPRSRRASATLLITGL
ncbi:MAG TPA: energy-coupling factor transporter transmembrane component T, partial [Nakamurella sp.]